MAEQTNLWDPVLQYEKSDVMAQPTVSPGCTMGSVSVGALLRMAVTTRMQPWSPSTPEPADPVFAPTEERTDGDHNSYF